MVVMILSILHKTQFTFYFVLHARNRMHSWRNVISTAAEVIRRADPPVFPLKTIFQFEGASKETSYQCINMANFYFYQKPESCF